MPTVTTTTDTCLLVVGQASFRRRELYLGSITELGNLDNDDRLRKATAYGFAGSQRKMHDGNNPEAEYRCIVSGADKPIVAMKFL